MLAEPTGKAGSRPALSRNCIPGKPKLQVAVAVCRESQKTRIRLFSTTFEVKGVGTSAVLRDCSTPLADSGKGFFVSLRERPCRDRFHFQFRSGSVMRKIMSLVLAVGMFLMGSLPIAHADDRIGATACRALLWLHAQQCSDGSFGFRRPDGTCTPSASVTADAVYALALVGEDPDGAAWTVGGKSALDALAKLAPSYVYADAGQAGKVARAVALAGGNPRAFGGLNLIATINAAYDSTTGRYHPNYLYRHTLAVEALFRAGEPVPSAAFDTLLMAQLSDGAWFWDFAGTQGDVDTTGRVMQLLAGVAGVIAPDAYDRAASFLEHAQASDGGWNTGYISGPPNGNSTALAVGGLWAAGFDPQASRFVKNGHGALDSLLTFQEPSGAFVYIRQAGQEEVRLMATLDVLAALASQLNGAPVCRAVYLPLVLR